MYKLLILAAFVVTGAAGLAGGMALRPAPQVTKTIEIRESAQSGFDHAQLASLIRGVVREEMQRSPATPAVAEKPKEPPRSEPSAEQMEAHERGQTLIAGAQRIGRWTDEDRDQFREVLRQSSAADRDELLHALIPAINRQEIKVDTVGPPL